MLAIYACSSRNDMTSVVADGYANLVKIRFKSMRDDKTFDSTQKLMNIDL